MKACGLRVGIEALAPEDTIVKQPTWEFQTIRGYLNLGSL